MPAARPALRKTRSSGARSCWLRGDGARQEGAQEDTSSSVCTLHAARLASPRLAQQLRLDKSLSHGSSPVAIAVLTVRSRCVVGVFCESLRRISWWSKSTTSTPVQDRQYQQGCRGSATGRWCCRGRGGQCHQQQQHAVTTARAGRKVVARHCAEPLTQPSSLWTLAAVGCTRRRLLTSTCLGPSKTRERRAAEHYHG